MEAKIRRLENNLVTIGTGVVILSLWTLFKTILYVIVYWGKIKDLTSTLQPMETALVFHLLQDSFINPITERSFIQTGVRRNPGKLSKSLINQQKTAQFKL